MNTGLVVEFPEYSGVRCLMMPYIQGDATSVPSEYAGYRDIIDSVFVRKGDIGYAAGNYPLSNATFLKSGEVHQIGILTPHESLPVTTDFNRQFLRIIGAGVHGREEYFTQNPLVQF